MLKHIVCFKLKQGESVDETIKVLLSMKGNVPSALEIEVGKDVLHSSRSYDIILQVTVKNREMLDVYQQDEYHCNVVKKHIQAVVENSITVDYEF